MPWKEIVVLDERMKFVLACRAEPSDSMAVLCRRFGISRPTGYKWLERYELLGPSGLCDASRAPRTHPNAVDSDLQERIVSARRAHPTWGARKLRVILGREQPAESWPAASTIAGILKRQGLSKPRPRRSREPAAVNPLGPCLAPNRVWCADFKGWFRTGDGRRCDPLTIMDGHSRYLLRCQAVARMDYANTRALFEATFRHYGLPESIRTDNGEPFAGNGLLRLSRLNVWWVRLGITAQRIEPGKPQQNGSHERMHGTLKRETASPPAATLGAQGRRFDAFKKEYNHLRPHEALAMATPASVYEPSRRAYPERLAELEYTAGHELRKVADDGKIRWKVAKVFLSKSLGGQVVGLQELDQRFWRVKFGPMELGVLDQKTGRLLRPCQRRRLGW
jgi:transposase InsO family protein